MEELRKAIEKLHSTQEALKSIIHCDRNNVENLKTFSLNLQDRVNKLEGEINANTIKCGKEESKKRREEIKNVKEEVTNLFHKKLVILEKKTETVKDDLNRLIDDKVQESNRSNEEASSKLRELLKDNENKINLVKENIKSQKKTIKNLKESFKCDECEQTFALKSHLRSHITLSHPKFIRCEICNETFSPSWMFETHLETHGKPKEYKCEECGKEFFLNWRFKQHMKAYNSPSVKLCKYLIAKEACPFDRVGCKFKHVNNKESVNKNVSKE